MSEEFFVVVVGIMPNQGLGTMTKCLMKLLPKIPQNPMKYVAKLPNWPKHDVEKGGITRLSGL